MFYEDCIDKKKTIRRMKRYLEFLSKHMSSAGYQDYLRQYPSVIKENIADYVWSKDGKDIAFRVAVFDDVSYEDVMEERKKKREMQVRWLFYGLQQLPVKQRAYVLERYVYHMETKAILQRHGIVESTLNRNLRKAYLDLAIILKLEVMSEDEPLP